MTEPDLGKEKITRRRWLIEQTYALALKDGYPANEFTVAEAVASTAMAHPEWDLDAIATREEWKDSDRRQ